MKHNVIEINGGTMTNSDMSVKNIYMTKSMFGILVHVFVKMENIQQVLWMIR